VTGITSKIGSAIAAVGLLACATPLAAQTWHHRGRALRYEAVWLERAEAGFRAPARWYRWAWRPPVGVVGVWRGPLPAARAWGVRRWARRGPAVRGRMIEGRWAARRWAGSRWVGRGRRAVAWARRGQGPRPWRRALLRRAPL